MEEVADKLHKHKSAGLGGPGQELQNGMFPDWGSGCLNVILSFSWPLFAAFLRWQLMGQTKTKKTQHCPAPRPSPLRRPVAPPWPPPTSQRSAEWLKLLRALQYNFYLVLNYISSSFHQVVRSGSSETRVEKRIVITADSDVDQEKVQTFAFDTLGIHVGQEKTFSVG